MKLYIVRHGETEWNRIGKLQGWQNSDLTEEGIKNAIKLGERLKDVDFSHIYTSPQNRALITAKYIKGNRDIKIEAIDDLKEMGFGLWEGLENEELIKLYGDENYIFWNKPEEYSPNGGETFDELFQRINNSLNYILNNSKEGNILVVSHGISIKALFAIINKTKLKDFWEEIYVDGTSLSIIDIKDDKMEIILKGDTSHMYE